MQEKRDSIDELLISALKAEPKVDLPYSFAPDLRRRIFPGLNHYKLSLLRIGLIIGVSSLCLAGLYFMNPEAASVLADRLLEIKYVLGFFGVVFLMIQYLDWKLVRPYIGRQQVH